MTIATRWIVLGTMTAASASFPSASAQLGDFGDPATLIHQVQGPGPTSPLVNNDVIVEGVVTAHFPSLGGFTVQEEDTDADGDTATSDGIFVFKPSLSVSPGNKVRLEGTVSEQFGRTQIVLTTGIVDASQSYLVRVPVTPVELPMPTSDYFERYEGMLVQFPQSLSVTDLFNLGRFGEISVSSVGPLQTPTNVVSPGQAANDLAALNQRNQIILDDGSTQQNPDPIIYPTPRLSSTNTIRRGDTVANMTGIMHFDFGSYRLQPTVQPDFQTQNSRTSAPADVGGNLKVASFNVLNYFTTQSGRGADNSVEFQRQTDKLVAAITSIDADVYGLTELENNGYGEGSAIDTLVDALNASAGAGTFAYRDPGTSMVGSDAITVGLIYKPSTVTPSGDAAVLISSLFGTPDPGHGTQNRAPIAQTFVENGSGQVFTVAVNHFKSKGASGLNDPTDPDFDQGDGQGFFNHFRTRAAQELADWLATDPTDSNDPDILIIGDLNSYLMEDPITALEAAGYANLLKQFIDDPYSFVFFGQHGALDHALATGSLATQVTGVAEWHINTDETRALDYNIEFKSPGQINDLYSPDPFRASDHDPIMIGLNLRVPEPTSLALMSLGLLAMTSRRRSARSAPSLIGRVKSSAPLLGDRPTTPRRC